MRQRIRDVPPVATPLAQHDNQLVHREAANINLKQLVQPREKVEVEIPGAAWHFPGAQQGRVGRNDGVDVIQPDNS